MVVKPCDRYVIIFKGDEGSLLDSNSSFNRMYTGSGPNIAAKKSYFERFQVIGSVTYGIVTYIKEIEFEPTFRDLLYANNLMLDTTNTYGNCIFLSAIEKVAARIENSYFINNDFPFIFKCEHTKIISKNNFFSCEIHSSNLVEVDGSNLINQNGDYSYPNIGHHAGCIGILIQSPVSKRTVLLGVFALNSII